MAGRALLRAGLGREPGSTATRSEAFGAGLPLPLADSSDFGDTQFSSRSSSSFPAGRPAAVPRQPRPQPWEHPLGEGWPQESFIQPNHSGSFSQPSGLA